VAIEKHLTLDRPARTGPQRVAGAGEFGEMVRGIRRIEAMRGDGVKAPRPEERDAARVARRSVVAAVDIRPAPASGRHAGLPPPGHRHRAARAGSVVGRRARAAIAAGTVLQWEQLEP
jgi:N,N'-diacetyllegionaminate synthase